MTSLPAKQLCLLKNKGSVTCSNRGWVCFLISDYISVPMSSPNKSSDFDHYHNTAAAAVKLLQSCPTLCDPIDGSPPGSPVPGILQARTLEWVAISFSNAWNYHNTVAMLLSLRNCIWSSKYIISLIIWLTLLCTWYHPHFIYWATDVLNRTVSCPRTHG